MKRRTLIRALLSVALVCYLAIALSLAKAEWRDTMCTGLAIEVQDSTACNFVSSDSIYKELGDLTATMRQCPVTSINTDSIEGMLNSLPTLEHAEVMRRPDGSLFISVVPMRPVARVFAADGTSYYLNNQGKRMPAQLRYRIDVPVIVDEGYPDFDPMYLLPVVDYIENDSVLRNSVTAINMARNGDIFIVPAICGHVLNIGDTTILDNKFARYNTICRRVLPHKGWDCYDTISVKFDGQLVGTYRNKNHGQQTLPAVEFFDEEDEDRNNLPEQPITKKNQ